MGEVIEELREILYSCEDDGEGDSRFANQLRRAIVILEREGDE